MKKLILLLIFISTSLFSQTNHFNKGVNLTSWFQSANIGQVQFTRYTKQDFINIKSLGCDVIRLPINFRGMTNGSPDYVFDNVFLNFLDEVTDWAEEVQINLILDNHTFDVNVSTSVHADNELIPQWTQIAERFKDKSSYIYYEILNEPHGINDVNWNSIQQRVVEAIRGIDTVHTIIVGGAGWNGFNNLSAIPVYDDSNLIYTFHFYEPFFFTHQGADWVGTPSFSNIANVPFPYSADKMPQLPDGLAGSWVGTSYNNYKNEGTVEKVKNLIDIAVAFKEERNVEVFCGEFGVYIPNSPRDDRVYWYETVRSYFEEKNISWTIWDYEGGFGIFNEESGGLFNSDLNVELVEALGLTAPAQSEFIQQPDTTNFSLYYDYIASGIINSSSWGMDGLNFYSDDPVEGNYCISWTGANRYNQIGFDFKPDKDLSQLLSEDYAVSLYIKGEAPGDTIDIRFIDTDTEDPNDHPWRMSYTIDGTITSWDGNWHRLIIPLNDFHDSGAWEDAWFAPIGAFDWTAVDRFEIVAEHHDLHNRTLWFDNIAVIDQSSVDLEEEKLPDDFVLYQNYPNPFNPSTKIKYVLPRDCVVDLRIFDILGRQVAVLNSGYQKAGEHETIFDGAGLSSTVYFYRLKTPDGIQIKKMLMVK